MPPVCKEKIEMKLEGDLARVAPSNDTDQGQQEIVPESPLSDDDNPSSLPENKDMKEGGVETICETDSNESVGESKENVDPSADHQMAQCATSGEALALVRSTSSSLPLQGLTNLGNSCYMNAVLQSLFGLYTFTVDLITFYKHHVKSLEHQSMTCSLTQLIMERQERAPAYVVNETLRKILQAASKVDIKFTFFDQQDAHEFLSHVLEVLKEEGGRPAKQLEFKIEDRKTCDLQMSNKVELGTARKDSNICQRVSIKEGCDSLDDASAPQSQTSDCEQTNDKVLKVKVDISDQRNVESIRLERKTDHLRKEMANEREPRNRSSETEEVHESKGNSQKADLKRSEHESPDKNDGIPMKIRKDSMSSKWIKASKSSSTDRKSSTFEETKEDKQEKINIVSDQNKDTEGKDKESLVADMTEQLGDGVSHRSKHKTRDFANKDLCKEKYNERDYTQSNAKSDTVGEATQPNLVEVKDSAEAAEAVLREMVDIDAKIAGLSNTSATAFVNPTSDNFDFEVVQDTKCLSCHGFVQTVIPLSNLILDIPNTQISPSLNDAVNNYFKTEEIEYSCEFCHQHTKAELSSRFRKLPRILILYLKRFAYRGHSSKVVMPLHLSAFISVQDHCDINTQSPSPYCMAWPSPVKFPVPTSDSNQESSWSPRVHLQGGKDKDHGSSKKLKQSGPRRNLKMDFDGVPSERPTRLVQPLHVDVTNPVEEIPGKINNPLLNVLYNKDIDMNDNNNNNNNSNAAKSLINFNSYVDTEGNIHAGNLSEAEQLKLAMALSTGSSYMQEDNDNSELLIENVARGLDPRHDPLFATESVLGLKSTHIDHNLYSKTVQSRGKQYKNIFVDELDLRKQSSFSNFAMESEGCGGSRNKDDRHSEAEPLDRAMPQENRYPGFVKASRVRSNVKRDHCDRESSEDGEKEKCDIKVNTDVGKDHCDIDTSVGDFNIKLEDAAVPIDLALDKEQPASGGEDKHDKDQYYQAPIWNDLTLLHLSEEEQIRLATHNSVIDHRPPADDCDSPPGYETPPAQTSPLSGHLPSSEWDIPPLITPSTNTFINPLSPLHSPTGQSNADSETQTVKVMPDDTKSKQDLHKSIPGSQYKGSPINILERIDIVIKTLNSSFKEDASVENINQEDAAKGSTERPVEENQTERMSSSLDAKCDSTTDSIHTPCAGDEEIASVQQTEEQTGTLDGGADVDEASEEDDDSESVMSPSKRQRFDRMQTRNKWVQENWEPEIAFMNKNESDQNKERADNVDSTLEEKHSADSACSDNEDEDEDGEDRSLSPFSVLQQSCMSDNQECDSFSAQAAISDEEENPSQMYRLVSIVNHVGASSSEGHYNSNVLDIQTDQWITFDDNHVSITTEEEVLKGCTISGYIFFCINKSILDNIKNLAVQSDPVEPSFGNPTEPDNQDPISFDINSVD